jgi:inhibitor of KinA
VQRLLAAPSRISIVAPVASSARMPVSGFPYSIEPLGDRALVIELSNAVSAAVSASVRRLCERLLAARLPGIRDVVPAFCSVTVHYEPLQFAILGGSAFDAVRTAVAALVTEAAEAGEAPARLVEIPVCYGADYGEDLETLARTHDMTAERVVELHTAPTYFVGMLGFAPGFPYLAGLDERLVTPRRASPRARVPRGSVAIGGEHTGVYPVESPGGWHIIGRTPLALFDLSRDPPTLLQAGDQVRFVAIPPEKFADTEATAPWR